MSERAPGPSGFAAHVAAEKAVMNTVAANQAAALRVEAIEARRLTPEVQELNDIAQIEIWGTHGRTAGFIDPTTGDALAAPIKGVVNEIRENRRYGTTEGKREAEAKRYEDQVQGLLDDDFELCQAKLIMDLRTEDKQSASKMIGKYVAEGMPALRAERKVRGVYAKKDAKRLEKIKKEGIFTRAEYEAKPRKSDGSEDDTKEMGTSKEVRKKLEDLTKERDKARVDYARRLAGRSSRHFLFGKAREEFGEEAVADALDRYEQARMRLTYTELEVLRSKGVDPYSGGEGARVTEMADAVANLVDEYRLAREIMNQEKIASGSYRAIIVEEKGIKKEGVDEEGVTAVERVKSKNPLSRSIAGFKDFWERSVNDSASGKVKRLGIAAGLGILFGAPAIGDSGVFLGPVLGAAGAGLAANEAIIRQLGASRKSRTRAERRWGNLHNELMNMAAEGGEWYQDPASKKTKPVQHKPQTQIKSKEKSLRMLRHGKIRKRIDAPIDNLAKHAFERSNRDNRRNQKIMVGSVAVGTVAGKFVQHH